MRFNRRNWKKYFDGSNKKTTIRLKKSRIGHHKAYAGRYNNPEDLGEFDIIKVIEKQYNKLTEQDARDDGFETLKLLEKELKLLNGEIASETIIYQHWTENIKNNGGKNKWKQKHLSIIGFP